MADRRMLSKKITDHDNFISLSASAQALYMHLAMSADDDGFCNQVSLAMFKAHAGTQDLEALVERRYILRFESGVVVVKHWWMHNTRRKDRFKPTQYQEELSLLDVKENGAYTEHDNQLATTRQPIGNHSVPQTKLNKTKLNKSSCLGAVDMNELLSAEDISKLYSTYENAGTLIDQVEDEINKKGKEIYKPFEYIVGYAQNRGWPEK